MACTRGLNSDFIVDVQGFVDSCENFIPKEVALTSLKYNLQGHWIVTPPCEFHELPRKPKTTNNWLTKYCHGIEWYEGVVRQEQLESLLREITKLAKHVYVRGSGKALYFERILSRDIINLEYKIPAFKNLPVVENTCIHHSFLIKEGEYSCAVRNIKKLKQFLIQNPKILCSEDRALVDGEDTVC